jgi:SAM-dependent methyltransferase
MKPVFVKSWLGISLDLVDGFSIKELPGEEYYQNVYKKFFNKYNHWDDLDSNWIEDKRDIARFIQSRIKAKSRVLSIGCGLGMVEKILLDSGCTGLEIIETIEEPLQWIKPLLPEQSVHVGKFPNGFGSGDKFDLIYLVDVDSYFNQKDWVIFLGEIRKYLNDDGRCLVITHSFQETRISEAIIWVKEGVKKILSFFNCYQLGRFMGWRRRRKEYFQAMELAEFENLKEGILDSVTKFSKVYWIEGDNLA